MGLLFGAGSGGMNTLGNAASIEMHLGRLAVFACTVSRQGTLSSKGILLKELLI